MMMVGEAGEVDGGGEVIQRRVAILPPQEWATVRLTG